MTTIHMQTETVRSTARQMSQSAAQVEAELRTLQRALQELGYTWQGGSSDEFSAQAQDVFRQLQARNEALSVLAGRVEHEVNEWEQVDQRGAASMRGTQLGSAWTWSYASMPIAAGGTAGGAALPAWTVVPVMAAVSVGQFLTGLPSWLNGLLERFFPSPVTVESPIAVESPPQPGKSGFGQLLENAPAESPPATESAAPQASAFDQYYNVTPQSQGNLYGSAACAPTSVSMALDYMHSQNPDLQTATPQELIGMLDQGDGTPGRGLSLSNLTDELGELGYHNISEKAGANMDELQSALQDGPVIVTTGVKIVGPGTVASDVPRAIEGPGGTVHAMLVKGLGAEKVAVNDPWTGRELQFDRATFDKMWTGGSNGMYVIRP